MAGYYQPKDFGSLDIIMKDSNGDLTYLVSINSTQRLTDHLGSVVAITDDQGTLISQQRYLPFGAVRTNVTSPNSPNTDYGYTGQRNLDEDIGLMDYKARFYSPVLNRFIQPDSIVPGMYNPQNLNRFSYVRNNPMKYTDPTGHDAYWCETASCQADYDKSRKEGFFSIYGVTVDKKAGSKELLAIMVAISAVGRKFAGKSGGNVTSAEAFRAEYSGGVNFTFGTGEYDHPNIGEGCETSHQEDVLVLLYK